MDSKNVPADDPMPVVADTKVAELELIHAADWKRDTEGAS